MAQAITLTVDQGISWTHRLQLFKDADGLLPIDDFTDTAFLMYVKKSFGRKAEIVFASENITDFIPDIEQVDGRITVLIPDDGVIELFLPREVSESIRTREDLECVFDLEMYAPAIRDPSGIRSTRVCEGIFVIRPEATDQVFP